MLLHPSNGGVALTPFQNATSGPGGLCSVMVAFFDRLDAFSAQNPEIADDLAFHATVLLEQALIVLDTERLSPQTGRPQPPTLDGRPSLKVLPGGGGRRG